MGDRHEFWQGVERLAKEMAEENPRRYPHQSLAVHDAHKRYIQGERPTPPTSEGEDG